MLRLKAKTNKLYLSDVEIARSTCRSKAAATCFAKEIFRLQLQQSIHAATFMKVLSAPRVDSFKMAAPHRYCRVLFLGFLCWTCKHQNLLLVATQSWLRLSHLELYCGSDTEGCGAAEGSRPRTMKR